MEQNLANIKVAKETLNVSRLMAGVEVDQGAFLCFLMGAE
jgi:hypothetical protein